MTEKEKQSKKTIVKPAELEKKIKDLKIELLKQPTKKKNIKKEIARALTALRSSNNTIIKSENVA